VICYTWAVADNESPVSASPPPPRAFSQGVGLVFQVVGGSLFLLSMFVCCGSSLLNKDFATRSELSRIAWHGYSAQRALSISLFAAVFFGLASAAAGLGMQADYRRAPVIATAVTALATVFWAFHLFFATNVARSLIFSLIALALTVIFAALFALAIAAAREMRKNPPAAGHDLIPPGTKIPYSHYHDDPPEVRLAAELEQRRQRLEVQRKELEALEEKMRKKLDGGTADERG
jgi:hypothetical protein